MGKKYTTITRTLDYYLIFLILWKIFYKNLILNSINKKIKLLNENKNFSFIKWEY